MSSSIPLKFAFLFSLSLAGAGAASLTTTTASSNQSVRNLKPLKSSISLSPPSPTRPNATVSDLLSLLGPPQQANSVNPQVARDLWSCFRFLAPFNSTPPTSSKIRLPSTRRSKKEIDDLIISPPPPVLELARLSVDSGGDPGSIHRALDPTIIPVPDIEGSKSDRCELTSTPYGRRFGNEGLNAYLEFLFHIIVERGPSVDLNVTLSRYDLFHGHLFIAKDTGRVGILFHAKEYPAYDKQVFPYNMGYCQVGSDVAYDEDLMNLRNILWLAPIPGNSSSEGAWVAPGVLVVLDAYPGGIIYHDLVPEYVDAVRTLYEDDFGEHVVDVNYLNVGGVKSPKFQLFLC